MNQLNAEAQRAFAVEIVSKLRKAGFTAYWAGGCVRDQLLSRVPKDYDVATSATPPEVRETLRPLRTHSVGASFGVITVLGPREAGQIEVATFRQDESYSDGRHPDAITFTTPAADAQRRDFTINGLFYDPVTEQVIDFVGGEEDLQRRLVRAIGDPHRRFTEDKLRMLRAVRFAATFDFELDEATAQAIRSMAKEVTVVSPERIAAELRLMLTHKNRWIALMQLDHVQLLRVILPELYSGSLDQRYFIWATAVLSKLSHPQFSLAWAALLTWFCDGSAVFEIGKRLKMSNDEIRQSRWLVEHRDALVGAAQQPWSRLQRILIAECATWLIDLHQAVLQAQLDGAMNVPCATAADLERCRAALALPAEQLNPPPLITGDDLVVHGVPRGKLYQLLLDRARDAQLDGRIATQAEALSLVDELLREQPEGRP